MTDPLLAGIVSVKLKVAIPPVKLAVAMTVPFFSRFTDVMPVVGPCSVSVKLLKVTIAPPGLVSWTCCAATPVAPGIWLESLGGFNPTVACTVTSVGVKVSVMVEVAVKLAVGVDVWVAVFVKLLVGVEVVVAVAVFELVAVLVAEFTRVAVGVPVAV
jgi:hypothetical protein